MVEPPTASPYGTELNWEVDKKTGGQRHRVFVKWVDGEPEKQRQGLRIQTESEPEPGRRRRGSTSEPPRVVHSHPASIYGALSVCMALTQCLLHHKDGEIPPQPHTQVSTSSCEQRKVAGRHF